LPVDGQGWLRSNVLFAAALRLILPEEVRAQPAQLPRDGRVPPDTRAEWRLPLDLLEYDPPPRATLGTALRISASIRKPGTLIRITFAGD